MVLDWVARRTQIAENPVRLSGTDLWRNATTHSLPIYLRISHMRLLDAVQEAAEERDLASLEAAMASLSADHSTDQIQTLLRAEVLPRLNLKSLLWLWESITSPLQRREALTSMSGKTTAKLCRDGFEFGKDFSYVEDRDGTHHLKLTAEVKNHLERSLSTKALVSLQLLTRHSHVSRT